MNAKFEAAMVKYPNASRIAIASFTSGGAAKWGIGPAINLGVFARAYGWNSHTVAAIKMVMK